MLVCTSKFGAGVSRTFALLSRLVANTYSVAEATSQMGAPSERWLIERLRSGAFPGRKVGRYWRMTDQDIADALDSCANDFRCPTADVAMVTGLTPRSRKKVAGLRLSATPYPDV